MVVLSSYWEDISHRIETQNQLLGIADRLVSENVPKAAHACACTCYPRCMGRLRPPSTGAHTDTWLCLPTFVVGVLGVLAVPGLWSCPVRLEEEKGDASNLRQLQCAVGPRAREQKENLCNAAGHGLALAHLLITGLRTLNARKGLC